MRLEPCAPAGWIVSVPTDRDRVQGQHSLKKAMTQAEKDAKRMRSIEAAQRKQNVLVLDFETDPFDHRLQTIVKPFCCVIYSPRFAELGVKTSRKHAHSIIFWEENHERLFDRIIECLEGLPEKFTAYAHNGGRFDYKFMLSRIRGSICFKGNSIMSAMVCGHQIRDSVHVVPQSLGSIRKDAFDYSNMSRGKRTGLRDSIIEYCVSDCRNLYEVVTDFRNEFGPRLTIGQAALSELTTEYPVKSFKPGWDAAIRPFYFGGHVKCLAGAGEFSATGGYDINDINSSYPNVMSRFKHPVGRFEDYEVKWRADPDEHTCFLDIECDNPGGVLMWRDPKTHLVTSDLERGNFLTTIHEFNVALKYNLISNVVINWRYNCSDMTDFSRFVNPRYAKRQAIKLELAAMKARVGYGSEAWFALERQDMFIKLVLNNAYGKFGQNPENFLETYITAPEEEPPAWWFKSFEHLTAEQQARYGDADKCDTHWLWEKPAPLRLHAFKNVGLAASVTGAARAVLIEALQHAKGALYCDTDSIICQSLSGVDRDIGRLGAWKLEGHTPRVIIAGKKLYGVWNDPPVPRSRFELAMGLHPDYTIKSKGVSSGELAWHDMQRMINEDATVLTRNHAPTLDRYGGQHYIERTIRATARRL